MLNRVDQKRKKGTQIKSVFFSKIKHLILGGFFFESSLWCSLFNFNIQPFNVKDDNITEIYTVTATLIVPFHLSALVAATGSPPLLLDSTVNMPIHSIAGCHHEIVLPSQKTCTACIPFKP